MELKNKRSTNFFTKNFTIKNLFNHFFYNIPAFCQEGQRTAPVELPAGAAAGTPRASRAEHGHPEDLPGDDVCQRLDG